MTNDVDRFGEFDMAPVTLAEGASARRTAKVTFGHTKTAIVGTTRGREASFSGPWLFDLGHGDLEKLIGTVDTGANATQGGRVLHHGSKM